MRMEDEVRNELERLEKNISRMEDNLKVFPEGDHTGYLELFRDKELAVTRKEALRWVLKIRGW